MPVYKREGVWYARVQVGNRRTEQSAGRGASQEQAKELEAAIRKRLREERHAERIGASFNRKFGEALLHYLKLPETKLLRSYDSLLSVAALIRPHLEDWTLEVVPQKAEEMKQAFIAEGLQPATINRRLALVRRILNLCHAWRWTTAPLGVSLLPENNERHIYPEVDLLFQLVKACPNRDCGDALLVIYFTGMRRSEFLKVNEYPKEFISKNLLRLYSGNKTKKPRRVPIARIIRPIVARMPLDVDHESLRYSWEAARAAVGRPDLHLHDLRHGFASLTIEAGGEFRDVMEMLGHTNAQTTKRYTHLLNRRLFHVVEKIDRIATAQKRRDGVKRNKTVIRLKGAKSA